MGFYNSPGNDKYANEPIIRVMHLKTVIAVWFQGSFIGDAEHFYGRMLKANTEQYVDRLKANFVSQVSSTHHRLEN